MDTTTSVFISYNSVTGFNSGWHGDDKVFICANDNGRGCDTGQGSDDRERAGSVMHNISGKYYHGSVPVTDVKRYVIYAGLYALEGAISMAKGLRSQAPDTPVTVVACDCSWSKKKDLLRGENIDMIPCECGGKDSMGKLVERALAG